MESESQKPFLSDPGYHTFCILAVYLIFFFFQINSNSFVFENKST